MDEASALAVLDHPNVIMVYDTFEDDSRFLIEMEYADGMRQTHTPWQRTPALCQPAGPLSPRLDRSRQTPHLDRCGSPGGTLRDLVMLHRRPNWLPAKDVRWLAYQLLQGIAHIHQRGIVHRDIKTENVFVTSQKILKCLAHLESFDINNVDPASALMPGEQYDSKCDIFSAGCVVHELCTLQRTFEASNICAVMNKMIEGEPEPLDPTAYSSDLQKMVLCMLSVLPADRPTAAELLQHSVFDVERGQWADKVISRRQN
ncbi:uncharacterized protein MONBRDRAFT_12777 [Monosiga brevicollis MX1]|uniref:non-specific serine/threonine protein kinase n=1 Tax=Monosiga brevicollis TaxID=81824 RepID=A9VDA3_MONBE|nr:uncharacterized protein MONBRDRAFT_12777 [Monosiga brevicollis MX1]EDQ84494.1 predicted protein [Monosiga brevicollis MX1]|eukprot:XP_001750681.1 hypothetical protein [Monosiga brevicollis MX1]